MFHLLRLVLDSIDKVPLVTGFVWASGSRHFAYPFTCRLFDFDSFDSSLFRIHNVKFSRNSLSSNTGRCPFECEMAMRAKSDTYPCNCVTVDSGPACTRPAHQMGRLRPCTPQLRANTAPTRPIHGSCPSIEGTTDGDALASSLGGQSKQLCSPFIPSPNRMWISVCATPKTGIQISDTLILIFLNRSHPTCVR
jgi:hypothetical protein